MVVRVVEVCVILLFVFLLCAYLIHGSLCKSQGQNRDILANI